VGDFDVRSTSEARRAIYELLASTRGDVVVDLTDVEVIDVTALKVLAVATRRATLDGHHLMLRGCGPAVRRMLHLSRLIRVVEVERAAASA
jgi:anti-anti-sigma factor